MAWCEMLTRHGSLPLADVMEPAIRHASRGFRATSFLADCVADCAADLARDPEIARVFMPDGRPLGAGARVVNGVYADTLRLVAREGADALYRGALGAALVDDMARHEGYRRDGGPRGLQHSRPRGAALRLSRLRDHRPAAALRRAAAHRAGAEDPGGLRPRRDRFRQRRQHPPAGRSAEDRVRRSRGVDRGPGLRPGAGGAAALDGLRRAAARRDRPRARAAVDLGRRAARGQRHHAPDGGRPRRAHRLRDADHQFAVRCALHAPRHRDDPEQLPVPLRSATRPRQFVRTRQARDLVDGPADRPARTAGRSSRSGCPAGCASSRRHCRRRST